MARELRPARGSIRTEPVDAVVVLCAQEAALAGDAVSSLAERTDRKAQKLRSNLCLSVEDLTRWRTLSPGERKRWQIGAALARDPDVLLLDEPTNHLDAAGREWLLAALRQYEGTALVVSHDRVLLDELTTRTLRLQRGRASLCASPYGIALEHWEAELRASVDRRASLRALLDVQRRQLHAARGRQQAADAQRSTRRRMKNRHDSDARTVAAQTKAEWADRTYGRQIERARRETERTAARLGEVPVDVQLGSAVFARYERCPSELIAFREAGVLQACGVALAELPALGVARQDRIWLTGANGAGKTTLLRELLGRLRVPRDKVLWLPQEVQHERAAHALDDVRAMSRERRGNVLSILAGLGVDPDRVLRADVPSPGEARKLLLALGLERRVWALVLDEPTNHLDIPSIERLELAMKKYPGALLLVTHDDVLAGRTTHNRWQIAAGRLTVGSVEPR
jgi:ATPase subunit of ABC transporter with duplicated ATPase domains